MLWNLVADLTLNFLQLDGLWNAFANEWVDERSFFRFLCHHKVVANSKSILEEQ